MQTDSRNDSKENTVRLIQITDPHLYSNPESTLLGMNTRESFDRVLEMIARQHQEKKIDLVVATGDISQDASEQSYQYFASAVEHLAPFYWLPGNHDERRIMVTLPKHKAAFQNRIVCNNWQILMLDTSVTETVHGYLVEDELQRLEQQLSHLDDGVEHTIVCMHHNPLQGSAVWMQEIGLTNADALLDVIKRHGSSVRALVHGHVHQELDVLHDGIRVIATPSTCIQFKPDVEDFTLDLLPPAYRWFDLHEDGSISTAVERLKNYVVNVDTSAEGY
ncbi:MAG TPA: 3',5'-cyclic-AMP phosphodiesterase [Pseudohongiella sp.]|nr:3',5'-cyclic-AMP phosphodiesterase [Pseudohongiella sp.]